MKICQKKEKGDKNEEKNKNTDNLENNVSKGQVSTVKTDKKLEKKSEKCDTDNCPHKEVKGRAPWIKVAEEEMKKYKGQKESSRSLYNRIQKTYFWSFCFLCAIIYENIAFEFFS